MNKLVLLCILSFAVAVMAEVLCPEVDPAGKAVYHPVENDCSKFYECNSGRAILLQCPTGLYFDRVLETCSWDANC